MKTTYYDLIDQTFDFPQEEFKVTDDGTLEWHGIPLDDLVKEYGSPLRLSYLPKISSQIDRARRYFNVAMAKADYKGKYIYCYCTKSSHFKFVIQEALKNDIHLETSSAYDIEIIERLHNEGLFDKDRYILFNGCKNQKYYTKIAGLINAGFSNAILIIDNLYELEKIEELVDSPFKIGLRIAAEEDPRFDFYTSRLGIGYKDIVPYYKNHIQGNKQYDLKILHFFINTGINDNAYYWNELSKCVKVYCDLKKICPSLDSLDIGGGLPIKNSLAFNFDYEYMIEEIISQIKTMCEDEGVPEPNIITEFGSFTVGESGAIIYSILKQKRQNDRELWNMIDSSFMTTLPDSWAISKKFILLPINNWNETYERVFLGGITCDSDDYYNSEQHSNAIYLPKYRKNRMQYIGFFNTGAYQETLGGYGGIQHCLTPQPRHLLVNKDKQGNITTELFGEEQSAEQMLKILGY
jgi:arginine decarboxylase